MKRQTMVRQVKDYLRLRRSLGFQLRSHVSDEMVRNLIGLERFQ